MRKMRILTILITMLMAVAFVSQSAALDPAQEEGLRKARMLLNESKVEEARGIIKELSRDNSSDFEIRLAMIDATLEEARILKERSNSAYEGKVYAAFGELKGMYSAHATSPQIFVSFARAYWINDRFGKAEKSLKKAFYYKPDFADAFMLRGDMFFERSKSVMINPFSEGESERENYNNRRIAEKSYGEVLSGLKTDTYAAAMAHCKLGFFNAYHGHKDEAKEHLNKAIELSPDSHWAIKSKEKLTEL